MALRLPDHRRFVAEHTRLTPVPGLLEIVLHLAHAESGLSRLGDTPYWAYAWSGGAALARHVLDCPDVVAGRTVLDLGAGSGLVAIAAAKAGARRVMAAEIDPHGRAAIMLNADANNVAVEVIDEDVTTRPPPSVDLILAGDVFYDAPVARKMTAFFTQCRAAGIDVLIGDPSREALPRDRLRRIASYRVAEFGSLGVTTPSSVFAFDGMGSSGPDSPHPDRHRRTCSDDPLFRRAEV